MQKKHALTFPIFNYKQRRRCMTTQDRTESGLPLGISRNDMPVNVQSPHKTIAA